MIHIIALRYSAYHAGMVGKYLWLSILCRIPSVCRCFVLGRFLPGSEL